jgi:hypothetical protein
MSAVQRAFVVGAIVASRDSYASGSVLLKRIIPTHEALLNPEERVENKIEEGCFNL